MKSVSGIFVAAIALVALANGPAQAASSESGSVVTINHAGFDGISNSALTVTFDKPMDSAKLAQVKSLLTGQNGAPSAAIHGLQPFTGPQGAFLYCDNAYSFSDSDGNYTFQHACGGTTGPWGYKISSGLCAEIVSNVTESGMSWTRNGANQARQAPHVEGCTYQFHGTYSPDDDYDFITYSDTLAFEIDVDGDTGTATLNITGSFTSAGCANGHACGM
jgi:hypothetical protein